MAALPRFASLKLDDDVRAFFRAIGPATLGSMGTQVANVRRHHHRNFPASRCTIGRFIMPTGFISFRSAVIGVAIGTVLLPEMSRRITAGDDAGAAGAQRRAFEFTLVALVPFVAAFLTVPDVITRALFTRGAFTRWRCLRAAMTLAAYSIGLIPSVMIRSAVATFYARKDTATPMKASLSGLAVNVILKFLLMGSLAQMGPGAGDRGRGLDQPAAGARICRACRLSRT